jgi:nitrite reductase/ring-hydroxylating ferredoxin subunit
VAEAFTAPSCGDLDDGDTLACNLGGTDVMLCRVGGVLYAMEDLCSHADTPLSDGLLAGHQIICPLHGASFDVRDGTHSGPPAYTGVRVFPVTESDDGSVVVEIAEPDAPDGDGYRPGGYFQTR